MTQPPPSAAFRGPPPVFNLDNSNRQVLTRKLASLLLKPLSDNPYRTIVLSGCSFGDAAANVAGPLLLTLARKQCLHTVILSDILASLPNDEALRSLDSIASSIGTYKRLCAVDLSHNAIGTFGMANCAPLLQGQPGLQVVNLENTGMSADAARLLCEYLTTVSPGAAPTTALRGLNVHRNRLESDGMLHIATVVSKSPLLQCLRISSVGANANAVATLSTALGSATSDLRELDISDNIFDDKCANELSGTLQKQPRLVRLVLSDLNITDSQFHQLVDALMVAQAPITELCLFGNEFTAKAVDDMNRLLVNPLSKLAVLDVSINELGDEGIRKMADALSVEEGSPPSPLTQLNVADTDASTSAIIHLSSKLLKLHHLTLFDFRENDIPKSISRRIAAAFPPSVVVLDDDDDDGAETDVEDDENEDSIELALQSLEALSKAERERSDYNEPRSPRSQSEVTRLVQFFSTSNNNNNTNNNNTDTSSNNNDNNKNNTNLENENVVEDGGPSGSVSESNEPISTVIDEVEAGALSDEVQPGTPPASRFLGSITSPITPPPSISTATQQNNRSKEEVKGDGKSMPATGEAKAEDDIISERRDEDDDVEMEDVGEEGNVMLSAKKLKETIASLSKEISEVAGELEMPVSRKLIEEQDEGDTNDTNDTAIENDDRVMSKFSLAEPSFAAFFLDLIGGFLVAIFIVVLVLAIVRSQEEATFRYVRV